MIKIIAFLALIFAVNINAQPISKNECVILLHGLGRTAASMNKMEAELQHHGYSTWNKSYTSTKKTIKDLALKHISDGIVFCKDKQATGIHFVTHSLGGILIRVYLQDNNIDKLGSIVMLSPPNKGSEVADKLKDLKLYHWITGPAGQTLGTDKQSTPNTLKPIKAPIGIITGNKSSDPWFSPFIAGEDDGKVSIESAKLNEMTDFLVIEAGHTFIMQKDDVINQTIRFLKTKAFNHISKVQTDNNSIL